MRHALLKQASKCCKLVIISRSGFKMIYVPKNRQASIGFNQHLPIFLGADDISSYRFVNLLALLASVFALYHMALQFYDSRAAFAAAALFSSGFLVLGEAHLAKTDTLLMALAIGQQWALMRSYMAWQAGLAPAVITGFGSGDVWLLVYWSKGRFCQFWPS